MNFAISQLNFKIADFAVNTRKIIEAIQSAHAQGADLVLFSELAVSGAPALDLLKSSVFLNQVDEAVQEIARSCKNIDCIVGAPYRDSSSGQVYNGALFCSQGKVERVISKRELNDQGLIHETPYFVSGSGADQIEVKGSRVLITLDDVLENEIADSVDLIISLRNSPFSYTEYDQRMERIKAVSQQLATGMVEVNQVGAQGQLIFDGRSVVVNSTEGYFDKLKAFQEDFKLFRLEGKSLQSLQPKIDTEKYTETALLYEALVLGIRDYFDKNGLKKALIGLSGGIDSSLVAALACEALGAENVKGILMPSMYSTGHSVKDAEDLANNFGFEYEIVPIKGGYDAFIEMLNPVFGTEDSAEVDLTEQNIQARVRAVVLMAISNKQGYVVLNTSNKSEAAMGYGTLYGDLVGAISVLGDVYKTQVFELSRYVNRNQQLIPEHAINKAPSAELKPGQKDSDSLPVYEILDPILYLLIEKNLSTSQIVELGHDKNEVERIVRMMSRVGFKLFQTPPALRVSPRAFGSGLNLPLVAKLA
ncbi:NAD+ synthase [Albibacterium profundi]|uniref:Glutamine-dependent NAD(+) synthetase n=1 Tax=Albibacterium profundi TaxID=3134906 RepID=A0ABV5CC36_9SPHI